MAVNCLVGCIDSGFQPVIDGLVSTPYVVCQFGADINGGANGSILTVGNKSISGNNFQKLQLNMNGITGTAVQTAHIKSFDFGYSNGNSQTLEITDEIGGDFDTFASRLVTTIDDKTVSKPGSIIQYGWIYTKNNGEVGQVLRSKNIYGTLVAMDVAFEFGRVNYTLKFPDLGILAFSGSVNVSYTKVPIYEAIENFLKIIGKTPIYVRKSPDNKIETFDGIDFFYDKDQPSDWQGNSLDPITTLNTWLARTVSAKEKGFVVSSSFLKGEEKFMYIQENPLPNPTESFNTTTPIAKYMINGGNCSDVISFTPKINYPSALAGQSIGAGGVSSGTSAASNISTRKEDDKNIAGSPAVAIVDSATAENKGKDAAIAVQKGDQKANDAAYATDPTIAPITAELKIKGDPSDRYCTPCLPGTYVDLTVINPFGLTFTNGALVWSHLSTTSCNNVMTNKNWMLMGVNHNIREGSYVTTLQLSLIVAPFNSPKGSNAGNTTDGADIT